jgi:mercuric ion binding protein
MKKFAFALLLALPLGCQPAAEKPAAPAAPATPAAPAEPAAPAADSNSTSATATEATTQLVMAVEGMSCPLGCPPAVKTALEAVDGVETVDVNFDSKTATVKVDPGKFDQSKALEALTSAGFTGSVN